MLNGSGREYSTPSMAVASDYDSKPDRACGGLRHVTLKSSSGLVGFPDPLSGTL